MERTRIPVLPLVAIGIAILIPLILSALGEDYLIGTPPAASSMRWRR